MSTTTKLDLDITNAVSGFDTVSEKAKQTGKDISDSARMSAEGLGFITSTLGRLNPALAFVGESTVKQLPSLIRMGDQLKRMGLAGGAIAATGAAIGAIAAELGRARKETVQAGSAGEGLLHFLEDASNFRKLDIPFFGRLEVIRKGGLIDWAMSSVHDWSMATNQALEKEREEAEKIANQRMVDSAAERRHEQINQAMRIAGFQEAADGYAEQFKSISDINAELERQAGIVNELRLEKQGLNSGLTEEKAAVIQAKTNELLAKRLEMQKQGREFQKAMTQQDEGLRFARELDTELNTQWELHARIGRLLAEQRKLEREGKFDAEQRSRIENELLQIKQKAAEIDKAGLDANKSIATAKKQQDRDIKLAGLNDPTKPRDELNVAKELAGIDDEVNRKQESLSTLLKSEKRDKEAIKQLETEIVELIGKQTSLKIELNNVRLQEIAAAKALRQEEELARGERRRDAEMDRQGQVQNWAARLRGFGGQGGGGQGGGGGGLVAQGPGGVDGQGAARPQGWQAWGGASRMSFNPFDQVGGGEGGGADIGGGGLDIGLAPANPQMQRKARNAARKAFRLEVDQIRDAFENEMQAVDKAEAQGFDVKDQRKDVRQRRKQRLIEAKGERGENEQENLLEAQKLARDKQVDAAAKRQKLSQDQLEVLRQSIDLHDAEIADIVALRKDLEAIRSTLGKAAANQRANSR